MTQIRTERVYSATISNAWTAVKNIPLVSPVAETSDFEIHSFLSDRAKIILQVSRSGSVFEILLARSYVFDSVTLSRCHTWSRNVKMGLGIFLIDN